MKIAITGSTGFVGSVLVKYFAARNHEIVAYGRQKEPPVKLSELATYVSVDIRNPFPLIDADVVIHAAAIASDTAQYDELFEANVKGTIHLMQAAKKCKKVIIISTSSVYHPTEKHGAREEEAILDREALSDYGYTKLLGEEHAIQLKEQEQELYILRPRGIYGVGDRQLLPRIMELVKFNRLITPGDMKVKTSITHINNLCIATELCLENNLDSKEVAKCYNVCDDGDAYLNRVILQLVEAVYGKKIPHVKIPIGFLKAIAPLARTINPRTRLSPILFRTVNSDYLLDNTKIKRELGYTPSHTFEETIPEIKDWVDSFGGTNEFLKNKLYVPWI